MQTNNNQQREYRTRINQFIRIPQIRVIGSDGANLGIMQTRDALKMAQDQGLDLIEISPKAVPPVCKIADYGKMKYEAKKKAQADKKNQVIQELKELTFRPNTDDNDLQHKLVQAKGFLEEGDRVKFTVRFRGREIVHSNIGKEKLEWLLKELGSAVAPNPQINLEGKFMSMVVSPTKKQ